MRKCLWIKQNNWIEEGISKNRVMKTIGIIYSSQLFLLIFSMQQLILIGGPGRNWICTNLVLKGRIEYASSLAMNIRCFCSLQWELINTQFPGNSEKWLFNGYRFSWWWLNTMKWNEWYNRNSLMKIVWYVWLIRSKGHICLLRLTNSNTMDESIELTTVSWSVPSCSNWRSWDGFWRRRIPEYLGMLSDNREGFTLS